MFADLIDRVYIAGQFAGKHYGLLDRRDGSIRTDRGPDGDRAMFLTDGSGWSALEVPLPAGSVMDQAVTGITSRFGMWVTASGLEETRRFYADRLTDGDPTWERKGEAWSREPEDGTGGTCTLRIGSTPRGTTIVVKQRRATSGLRRSVEATLSRVTSSS